MLLVQVFTDIHLFTYGSTISRVCLQYIDQMFMQFHQVKGQTYNVSCLHEMIPRGLKNRIDMISNILERYGVFQTLYIFLHLRSPCTEDQSVSRLNFHRCIASNSHDPSMFKLMTGHVLSQPFHNKIKGTSLYHFLG